MGLNVNNKIVFLQVLMFFVANIIFAQQKIDEGVFFIGKQNNSYVSLNKFLTNYEIDNIKDIGKCSVASNVFKFEVTPKGKVVSLDIQGDLPIIFEEKIKERILLLEDLWSLSDVVKGEDKNLIFYYPVYMSINLEDECNVRDHESFGWLTKVFDKEKVLFAKDKNYMIRPEYWSAIR